MSLSQCSPLDYHLSSRGGKLSGKLSLGAIPHYLGTPVTRGVDGTRHGMNPHLIRASRTNVSRLAAPATAASAKEAA